MNRFLKMLSLALALLVGAMLLASCRNEKDISEKLDLIFEACDKAIGDESGELLIHKTVKLDADIEDVLESSTEETFVQFRNNSGDPDFNLTRDYSSKNSANVSNYEFAKEGDVMIELFDGSGNYVTEAPDIFEEFKVKFTASDVDEMVVTPKEKGFKEYKFYMKAAYANGFDTESDGLKKDCVGVAYCYYVDNYKNLSNILREYVYTVTYGEESQKLTEFIDAKID